ncbi:hypothetical protein JT358_04585 [Micrococcales bacterium 31B]|nr:hypothetical protein [Micrococcales bacterium 31B]
MKLLKQQTRRAVGAAMLVTLAVTLLAVAFGLSPSLGAASERAAASYYGAADVVAEPSRGEPFAATVPSAAATAAQSAKQAAELAAAQSIAAQDAFLQAAASLPGVTAHYAFDVRSALLGAPGAKAPGQAASGFTIAALPPAPLQTRTLDAGAWPAGNEIAVPASLAKRANLTVGEALTVFFVETPRPSRTATAPTPLTLRVSGIVAEPRDATVDAHAALIAPQTFAAQTTTVTRGALLLATERPAADLARDLFALAQRTGADLAGPMAAGAHTAALDIFTTADYRAAENAAAHGMHRNIAVLGVLGALVALLVAASIAVPLLRTPPVPSPALPLSAPREPAPRPLTPYTLLVLGVVAGLVGSALGGWGLRALGGSGLLDAVVPLAPVTPAWFTYPLGALAGAVALRFAGHRANPPARTAAQVKRARTRAWLVVAAATGSVLLVVAWVPPGSLPLSFLLVGFLPSLVLAVVCAVVLSASVIPRTYRALLRCVPRSAARRLAEADSLRGPAAGTETARVGLVCLSFAVALLMCASAFQASRAAQAVQLETFGVLTPSRGMPEDAATLALGVPGVEAAQALPGGLVYVDGAAPPTVQDLGLPQSASAETAESAIFRAGWENRGGGSFALVGATTSQLRDLSANAAIPALREGVVYASSAPANYRAGFHWNPHQATVTFGLDPSAQHTLPLEVADFVPAGHLIATPTTLAASVGALPPFELWARPAAGVTGDRLAAVSHGISTILGQHGAEATDLTLDAGGYAAAVAAAPLSTNFANLLLLVFGAATVLVLTVVSSSESALRAASGRQHTIRLTGRRFVDLFGSALLRGSVAAVCGVAFGGVVGLALCAAYLSVTGAPALVVAVPWRYLLAAAAFMVLANMVVVLTLVPSLVKMRVLRHAPRAA